MDNKPSISTIYFTTYLKEYYRLIAVICDVSLSLLKEWLSNSIGVLQGLFFIP